MRRLTRVEQRARTRQRVYQAALDAFRRDGVDAARIDDIAQAAGVSHGTFYFHFPTKDDVLAQRLAEGKERFAQVINGLPVRATLGRALETACQAIADDWENDPKLFTDVGLLGLRRATADPLAAQADPARAALAARFKLAVEREELTSALPPELLADLFLINTLAASLAWVAQPGLPLMDVLRMVVELFLRGAATPNFR